MSVIARLEVIPMREGSTSEAVARAVSALDQFDVAYETTPTDTVIESADPNEVFAAAAAAHRAVPDQRLVTSLEVEEDRVRPQSRRERVASVERKLGRPARRESGGGRPSGAAVGRRAQFGQQVGNGQQQQPGVGQQQQQRTVGQPPSGESRYLAASRVGGPPTQ